MSSHSHNMLPVWKRPQFARRFLIPIVLITAAASFLTASTPAISKFGFVNRQFGATSAHSLAQTNSKYAYATFLSETDNEREEENDDDVYLTCTRMLAFQLLHDKDTRTNTSIPFIVLVSPGVAQWKREKLQKEGAIVVEFPSIKIDWMKPGRERWKHVMDKLNVFKLVQFDKILLLDSDIVVFKRLDGIFEEPETEVQTNLGIPEMMRDDEGPQPQRYLMAADSAPLKDSEGGENHPYPAPRSGVLNAGFVVIHPSYYVFDHYFRVASIEGRTPGTAPENNLWEYIHRPDGNLPFTPLKPIWVINHGIAKDVTAGIAAVHEKWFRNSLTDHKLKEALLKSRWRMDGYWGREG